MIVDVYGNPLVTQFKKQHEDALTEEAQLQVIKNAAALIRKGVPVTALVEDSETRKLLLEYTRNVHAEHMKDGERMLKNRMLSGLSPKQRRKWKKKVGI